MERTASYRYIVREGHDGRVWIEAQPADGDIFAGQMLSFDLAAGATVEAAQEVARYLRDHVTSLTLG